VSALRKVRFVLALARRDARGSGRRALLVVTSVAIGVGALVAINSFTDGLRESVRKEARALLGADLAVYSGSPFSPKVESLLADVRRATRPPADLVQVVTFGAMAFVPGGTTTRLVQVLAVDSGYPFYGVIETAPAGEWEHLATSGGAIVDGALLVSLGARVGDDLTLGEARFKIQAAVQNMPGDVGVRSAIGPRVFIPRSRVAATNLLSFGSRGQYQAYFRLPARADADSIAKRFRRPLAAERVTIRTVSDDQRRLSETLGRFGNFLGLVALVAVLLGGLGVASAVHVFVKRRLPAIAVLRCLGASAGTILAAYLLQALVVGLLGSLLGALLGASIQLALPRLLRDMLPVDVAWTPSPRAILGGIGIGVWSALVFSLLPLLAVRRVSPLAVLRRDYEPERVKHLDLVRAAAALALAASLVVMAVAEAGALRPGLAFAGGIGLALGALALSAFALVRALRRFFPSRLPYLYRQGLANLYRPANQTLMVVLALGFGAFLLSTLLLVQHNLLRGLRVDRGAARPNVVFFDVQPDQRQDVEKRVRAFGPITALVTPIVPMRIQTLKGRAISELLALEDATQQAEDPGQRAEDSAPRAEGAAQRQARSAQRPGRWALRREYRSSYRDTLAASERIVAGSWWRPGEWRGRTTAGPVPIAMDVGLARELQLRLGDEIVWDVQGVSVPSRLACLRDVEWARFEPNFFVVFPEGPLDDAPQSYVVLSRVDDPGARARLQRSVVENYPNVSTLDLAQVQRAIERVLDRVILAVRFMALFSLAAGATVLAGAVASSRQQRVREGALLRTLGATRPQLVRILLAEYAVLGALAAGAAILLSSLAAWALTRFVFDGSFALPGPSLLALLLAILGLTMIVGLAGSTEVWRRPPLEVLRAE
jgi:putative ABC transport system permease protein